MTGPYRADTDRANRLHAARKAAGFRSAREAAVRFGWSPKTYQAHEAANLFFDEPTGKVYAAAFGVSPGWLYRGSGKGLPVDRARQARFDLRTAATLPLEQSPAGRLRAARRLAGYRSVGAAAEALGANRTTVSAHEAGQNAMPQEAALKYARAYGVKAEWLVSGKLPTGLPSGVAPALEAILGMHRESEGRFFSAFGALVRARPPELRPPEKEDSAGSPGEPKVRADGDTVREYSARALFLKLAGQPGALASSGWSLPKGYLAQIYGCEPSSTVLLVVPEGMREYAAGTRLLIDTGTVETNGQDVMAVVTEDGHLALVGERSGNKVLPGPSAHHRVAGRIAARFEPTSP